MIETIHFYSDEEVIRRVLDGEQALFEVLIRRSNAALYKTGRSYRYNHEETQDLMQDTFIDAYCNLSKFENRSSFKTWIIKIMLNHCYRRQQKWSVKHEAPGEINDQSIPMYATSNSDPFQSVLNKELGEVIEQALQRIPLDYRMVFSLREITMLSVEETAEALQISPANVKVKLHRAKAMLRHQLEKAYPAEDMYEFHLTYCDTMTVQVMDKIKVLNEEIQLL